LDVEISHLKWTFRSNGHSNLKVSALDPKQRPQTEEASRDNHITLSTSCVQQNQQAALQMKTIHIPVKKNAHMVRPINDKLGLEVAGIYCVPYERGKALGTETKPLRPHARSI
jgi:hypothetical protein